MKDKVRYEVKELENGMWEFTHIEKREGLDGEEVEVIKGRNSFNAEAIEENIKKYSDMLEEIKNKLTDEEVERLVAEYKENIEAEVELMEQHIETMKEMLKAITTG